MAVQRNEDEREQKYFARVDELYRQVGAFLKSEFPEARFEQSPSGRAVSWSNPGTKPSPPRLDCYLPDEGGHVGFYPQGPDMVGAEGGVQVVGEGSPAYLLYMTQAPLLGNRVVTPGFTREGWYWSRPHPERALVPLDNEAAFRQLFWTLTP